MESLLCILLLLLVLLIFFSNRQNTVNRWCALAAFLFWLGLAKEAMAYNLLPLAEKIFRVSGLAASFGIPYSLMTWALYALAVPTAILFALALGEALPTPKIQRLFYLPALVISFVFYPWQYHIFQKESDAFWTVFACYNLLGCAVFALMLVRAVKKEPAIEARRQKKLVASIMLPPVVYWVLSVFLTHPLHLTHLNKLWQLNALVIMACIVFYVVSAFKGGMMGLRLTGESYRWNSDMGLVHRSASYTRHMIKNQTAKMSWCVENLTAVYQAQSAAPPEELAILSRSIAAIQNYTEKAVHYADAIVLTETEHSLEEMLQEAFLLCTSDAAENARLKLSGTSGVVWLCDRAHMTEVFVNLFTNALEAMPSSAPIDVIAQRKQGCSAFTLSITDYGIGMNPEDVRHIFTPYFTTKDSPGNLGLGLAYCKNVIQKHQGTLEARSQKGKGATFLMTLPFSRVSLPHPESGKGGARHG